MIKTKSLSIDVMSYRLKILSFYLASFPSPDHKLFSEGEMIENVLSTPPTIWINSMIIAGLEPMEKSYEGLIDHLEKLESCLPDETIPKKEKYKDDPEYTSIFMKERHKVQFGEGARYQS